MSNFDQDRAVDVALRTAMGAARRAASKVICATPAADAPGGRDTWVDLGRLPQQPAWEDRAAIIYTL